MASLARSTLQMHVKAAIKEAKAFLNLLLELRIGDMYLNHLHAIKHGFKFKCHCEAFSVIPSQSHLSSSNSCNEKEVNRKLDKQIKVYVFNAKCNPGSVLL